MTIPTSFRARLVVGSVLWTFGTLLAVSVLLIVFLALHPQPHKRIYTVLSTTPAVVTLTIGVASMLVGAMLIGRGLSAIGQLRTSLAAVHRGESQAMEGTYPSEVQPLVDDLNALLVDREARIRRAVERAGDLAHGLKTPLAVLSRDAEQAAVAGHTSLATSIAAEVDRMRRQIDYQLAHARAAGSRGRPVRCAVLPAVDGLRRTLDRVHADRSIAWEIAVVPSSEVACQREDLDEMLGNLLDNACTWSRGRVCVASDLTNSTVSIVVDDDGPGLDGDFTTSVLQRGVRADERVPGSGFGLAIVRELAELYGGTIELTRAPIGGLRARLVLPAASGKPQR